MARYLETQLIKIIVYLMVEFLKIIILIKDMVELLQLLMVID
jgi:hypothetical protein